MGDLRAFDPENAGADESDPQSWNGYGYARSSALNPGWSVSIDLVGTTLESVTMEGYRHDNGEHDWVFARYGLESSSGMEIHKSSRSFWKSFLDDFPYAINVPNRDDGTEIQGIVNG